MDPGKPEKCKGKSEFIGDTVWGKDNPSKEKLNKTLLFVVKLLFFIINDAALGQERAGGDGGLKSWTRTYESGEKMKQTLSKVPCKTSIYDDSNDQKRPY